MLFSPFLLKFAGYNSLSVVSDIVGWCSIEEGINMTAEAGVILHGLGI